MFDEDSPLWEVLELIQHIASWPQYKVLIAAIFLTPCWTFFVKLVEYTSEGILSEWLGTAVPEKTTSRFSSAMCHVALFFMWVALSVGAGWDAWILDVDGWPEIMNPRSRQERAARMLELELMTPCYMVYMGFAGYLWVQVVRGIGTTGATDLRLVFFMSLCIQADCWRAGVLVRLIHAPVEALISIAVFYHGLCENGTGSPTTLAYIEMFNCVVFFWTRLVLYGVFAWRLCESINGFFGTDFAERDEEPLVCMGAMASITVALWVCQLMDLWSLCKEAYQAYATADVATNENQVKNQAEGATVASDSKTEKQDESKVPRRVSRVSTPRTGGKAESASQTGNQDGAKKDQ